MSTLPSTVTNPADKKTQTPRTRGKKEIVLDIILTDSMNDVLKEPYESVIVEVAFDIVDKGKGYAVAAFREFVPDQKVKIKFQRDGIAFEAGDNNHLVELMKLDSNIEAFLSAFKTKGYRVSKREEFIPWHALHCRHYKKDKEPAQKSINGGVWDNGIPGREFPMLEGGYAMDKGSIYPPAQTYMSDELIPIFCGDDTNNKTAILLIEA